MSGQARHLLAGRTVVVPRARTQAASMIALLESYGASVLAVPTIEFLSPEDPQPMAKAVHALCRGDYAWVVLTSTNAVDALFRSIENEGLDNHVFSDVRVAAVGAKTEKALQNRGVNVELVPPSDRHNAAGLVEVFPQPQESGLKVLLPRADIATAVLPDGLEALGYQPHHVTAYRTVSAPAPDPSVAKAIQGGEVDAICFTSGSTVRNFIALVGKPTDTTTIACIGPMAANAARKEGLTVRVMPQQATVEELVDALASHLRSQQR